MLMKNLEPQIIEAIKIFVKTKIKSRFVYLQGYFFRIKILI